MSILSSKNRNKFFKVGKSLHVSQQTREGMCSFKSFFRVQKDWHLAPKVGQVDSVLPEGTSGPDLWIVNTQGISNSQVLVRSETLESFRQGAINSEFLEKTAHIIDCLLSGVSVIFPKVMESEWDLTPSFLLVYSWVSEGRWVKELKFHLCSLFNRYMKQELPEDIGSIHRPGTILIGPIMRRVTQKLGKKSFKSLVFLNTILNGFKKGLPIVDSNTVLASAEKHKERLSRDKETPSWLLEEVRRTGREVFGTEREVAENTDFWWINAKEPESRSPIQLRPLGTYASLSTRACVESGRSNGGALGKLVLDSVKWDTSRHSNEVPSLGFDDRLFYMATATHQLVQILYTPRYGTHEIRAPFIYGDLANERRIDVCSEQGVLDGGTINDFYCEESLAKFILEPLKVRTITAMGFGHNALYPEIQKGMLDCLQKFPAFALTGRPVDTKDISNLHRKTQRRVPEWFNSDSNWVRDELVWVSGDYSGATDSCHMDLSSALVDTVSDDLFVRHLLLHNLSQQKVSYEHSGLKKDAPETFLMTNGQLMGSRFSFPLLCVFNLAIYRYCLEKETGRSWPVSRLPVLVNGDDILFLASKSMLSRWESCLPLAGLEKSIGKNYVSQEFCTINSKLFLTPSDGDFEEIPYLNMGLVYGMKKQPFSGSGVLSHEKQEVRFKSLVGNFVCSQDLPEDMSDRYEAQIRGHRPDIHHSSMSDVMLGFKPDRFIGDTLVLNRDECLKDILWNVDPQFKTRCAPFEMSEERSLSCHLGILGSENDDAEFARRRTKLYKRTAAWDDRRVFMWWRRIRLEQLLCKGHNAWKERALKGVHSYSAEKIETSRNRVNSCSHKKEIKENRSSIVDQSETIGGKDQGLVQALGELSEWNRYILFKVVSRYL